MPGRWPSRSALASSKCRARCCPYLQRQLVEHGLTFLPIQFSHLEALEKLPLHHRDPFDRLLVAQAIDEDATLITVDAQLRRYKVKTIS